MRNREQSIGRWISILFRIGSSRVGRLMAPLGLGKGQYMFLTELFHEDGITQEELAVRLWMDKGTTARALAKLEKAGFVRRETSRTDKRAKIIRLTDKAHAIRDEFFDILWGASDALTKDFTPEERRDALSYLKRMVQNLEAIAQEGS